MSYSTVRVDGSAAEFDTDLATAARSVDQRVRLPLLIEEVERRGGKVVTRAASVDDLEDLARDHDLVVVSTGRGGLASLFPVDAARSPYTVAAAGRGADLPARGDPRPGRAGAALPLRRGRRRVLHVPGADRRRPCDIFVVEGVPGGPLDAWDDVAHPAEPPARLRQLLGRALPGRGGPGRRRDVLVDDHSVLQRPDLARRTPSGRHACPSGAPVLGMADVVVLNDPLTSQGSNNATKSASFYLEAITAHRGRVRRGVDAADLRQLLARLGAVGHRVDQLLAAAGAAAPARGRRRRRPAPAGRRADRRRLRRRAAVRAVVVRRRRGRGVPGAPRSVRGSRGSTRATCDGRWASTPPA